VPRVLATGPDAGKLPALAFDRQSRRLFPVVSPVSWEPLPVCRDDALLRDAGLEPWSGTTARYLHRPEDSGPPTFYTWSLQDGAQAKAGVRVRRRHDLYRDLVAGHAQLSAERQRRLAGQLPELSAAMRELGPDEVEARLVPLNYYEASALALELQDLHFDEFCDLAGGASLGAATAANLVAGASGRTATLARLDARLAGERQWLAAPWTRGDEVQALVNDPLRVDRLALEAAVIKLHAFVQVCRGVRAFHCEFGQPHLGVSSDNVMLRLLDHGDLLPPARWNFAAVLVDVGASHRLPLAGLGQTAAVSPLCLPSTDAVGTYSSPFVDPAQASRELTLRASAVPCAVAEAPSGLRLELRSARERLDGIRPGDVVRIQPDTALPATGEQPLLGSVCALTQGSATAVVTLEPALCAALPGEPFEFAATATFHRRLQTPCDLFGLGMLLARALLVHDERDVFAVREVWDRILDRFDMTLASARAPDAERVQATLRNLLDTERVHLGSASVLWPKALREVAREPIPAALWRELLLLVGRLLTSRAGFSFAAHHGDVPDGQPAAPLDRVLAVAEELLAALQLELTEAAPRGAEIAAVAGDLVREINTAMVGRPGGGA